MITALVLAEGSVGALALTLSALVPGVTQSLVGDAVVLTRTGDPLVERVAEEVGATLVALQPGMDPWRVGASVARREWLLCLQAGDVPEEGWIPAIERFVAFGSGARPLARLRQGGGISAGRLVRAAEVWAGARRARAGDLAHRSLLAQAAFPERVRPVRLAARIVRGPGSL